uniref:Transmembrane protein 272 n=1 Tax=Magallana gigas TaxID=29159 RepID=A0A8W8JST0_MAGGI
MNGTRDRSNGPTFTVFIPRRPPPQDSIYGKIKRAKENSDGNTSFLSSIFAIFCSSTVVIVLLVIVGLVLPIAPIVIGALYLDDCPSEKYIPIYLVVTGSISMLYCCCGRCCNREQEDEGSFIDKVKVNVSRFCALCVIAWFIAGNVWVFSSYGDLSTDPASGNYCHPIAFNFAFWYIIVMYSLCGVFVLVVACCFCAAACTCTCPERKEAPKNNAQEAPKNNAQVTVINGVKYNV